MHGITTEQAMSEGIDLLPAMVKFQQDLIMADEVIGHNVLFDVHVVAAEFIRCGMGHPFIGKNVFDTMLSGTDVCKLPGESISQRLKVSEYCNGGYMDSVKLAQLFVDRAEAAKRLAKLDEEIKTAVLEAGESQKIAGVTATYYKEGEETPDYKSAVESHPDFKSIDLEPYTTVTETVRWKDVANALGLEVHGAPKAARVVIK